MAGRLSIHCGLVALAASVLTACGSGSAMRQPVSAFYCDSFLIYDMCAQDLDRDGEVELVYFADTNEVFLYRDESDAELPLQLTMHRCALPMNEEIIQSTSRLFLISDETSLLERSDIRGSLMLSYVSYLPRVAACHGDDPAATEVAGDDFDFEFEF